MKVGNWQRNTKFYAERIDITVLDGPLRFIRNQQPGSGSNHSEDASVYRAIIRMSMRRSAVRTRQAPFFLGDVSYTSSDISLL